MNGGEPADSGGDSNVKRKVRTTEKGLSAPGGGLMSVRGGV